MKKTAYVLQTIWDGVPDYIGVFTSKNKMLLEMSTIERDDELSVDEFMEIMAEKNYYNDGQDLEARWYQTELNEEE